GVHEVIEIAVVIHVLDVPMVETRPREAVTRLERLLDEVPATDVAELHAYLRTAAPHLDVLELDDLVQGAVELDRHAALDLTGRHHFFFFRLRRPNGTPSSALCRPVEEPLQRLLVARHSFTYHLMRRDVLQIRMVPERLAL